MRKISLLVGAGLVYDATLPMSVDLAQRLKASIDDEGKELEHLLDLYYFLNGGIRFKKGMLKTDPDNPVNIEEIANAAYRLLERTNSPLVPFISGWNSYLNEIEANKATILEEFIKLIYRKLHKWLRLPEKSEKYAYLQCLSDFHNDQQILNIFSLNYDLVIESALRERDVEFENGFSSEGWKPDLLKDTSQIKLFKLHGSLDWVDDDQYGIVATEFPKHVNSEEIEGTEDPCIIFGTESKLTGKEPFLSLLYHFSDELSTTDVLVVIGYSFQDSHLNEIIEQRMRQNTKMKVIVVSPNASEAFGAFDFFANNPKVSSIKKGAKEAFNTRLIEKEIRRIVKDLKDENPF